MNSVGRIAITGTVGYDLSYISLIPTETGRKIRFVTNRQLRFGEVYNSSQSVAYNLTAGEIEIDCQGRSETRPLGRRKTRPDECVGDGDWQGGRHPPREMQW
jgi:hypothetical protein